MHIRVMAAAGLGNAPVDIGAAEIDPLPGVVLDILWELMESSGNAATMLVSDRDNFIPNLFMSACGDYITNSALQEDSAKFMAAYGRYGTPKGSGLERSFERVGRGVVGECVARLCGSLRQRGAAQSGDAE